MDDRAYRRGYRHGYNQALNDIRAGKKLSRLFAWMDELLFWNLRMDWGEMIFPPVYPSKLKRKNNGKGI